MKPARVVIMAVAVLAAGLAGYLAMNLTSPTVQVNEISSTPIIQKMPTIDVLVTTASLPVGSRLNEETIEWKGWPEDGVIEGLIRRDARPDAITELTGAVVRLPIFAGEPLRPEKIVDSSSRIMSSLLPSGKRAVATEISVATSAGGFILPNDRVDVIMVRRKTGEEGFLTEVILSNIRILAIDQRIEQDAEGNRTAVGTTATLELNPEQTKIITVAQQMADRLTLALRSVADVHESDIDGAKYLLSGEDGSAAIQLIRSGTITKVGATN
ncbi:MAG: Flp pilus assembly protein CpaB [Hoeflea sp.]|uniref:Flp pilus assembly protein CpaB n=1 Tax=Hoeflea sp. TaxID=1940281 RepID=UPI001D584990|nr:Flp pilus assembly protein CpaB [Hoeflea sp.]MBU4531640.1 Flp pilus assembly protein CpaB [Alphaproteobacteria bacterium]MBU4544497.1 Flp pilus assembly protein CpaB [Alphaproteobacteria bacterium]MBU4552728.1 Flp pilus assembly protein CpaB [Alphaproteobacteria bacterium]MBV1724916.1 Flp pilus assembly protein CpaB [Hoeflea sp.]MBV1760936.1 Flp pilus assembly protein CpaB [Hoeflea sp.]